MPFNVQKETRHVSPSILNVSSSNASGDPNVWTIRTLRHTESQGERNAALTAASVGHQRCRAVVSLTSKGS